MPTAKAAIPTRPSKPASKLGQTLPAASGKPPPVDPRIFTPEEVEEIEEARPPPTPSPKVCLALSCPACDYAWNEPIDVAAFLWAEIEIRARLLLWDVHILASAYSWSEPKSCPSAKPAVHLYLEWSSTQASNQHDDRLRK